MEDFPATGSLLSNHRAVTKAEMGDAIKEELPVITKVSLMKAPEDFDRNNSPPVTSHTVIETTTEKPEDLHSLQQFSQPMDNPHVLLLLLHQKDLEIKGLKNAARRHPPDRLACILQELVRTRQKGPSKKNQTEDNLRKEIEQLNSELENAKENHMKEMQKLQEKLMRSQLCILHLQDEVKNVSSPSDHGSESSVSLDEGAKLACESFELWSETGNRLLSEKSDLRLRRIPKHTSFVDAFHKFGSIICSDEDKDEKVISSTDSAEVKGQRDILRRQSSQESSKMKESQSDLSSWAILPSQKSDFISTVTDTRTTDSSSSLPSLMGKIQQWGSFDARHSVDYWKVAPSNFCLGKPPAGKTPGVPVPFMEGLKRDSSITGSVKIVSVHRQGKFVRILNQLLNKEVDLSGYILQQWVGGSPVSIYRFPNGTVLPAQHHITVMAAGANLTEKQPSDTVLGSQGLFRAGPECTTILCNCSGQAVSQYMAPHRFTAAADAYSDNVDLSVDKFPLTDDKEESLESPWPSKEDVALPAKTLQKEMMDSFSRALKTRHPGPISMASSASTDWNVHPKPTKRRISEASSWSSIVSLKSVSYPVMMKESYSSTSEDECMTSQTWKPPLEEPKAREFKTTLDTTLPMVALIGQKSARSKYGFKYMSYPPTSTDLHLRRYYYGH